MWSYAYVVVLMFSLTCLILLDKKHKLAWFWNKKITFTCILVSLIFFLTWDVTGINLQVFSTNQDWVTGLFIATPNLPIEEFLFLTLLSYLTILLWRWRCLRT